MMKTVFENNIILCRLVDIELVVMQCKQSLAEFSHFSAIIAEKAKSVEMRWSAIKLAYLLTMCNIKSLKSST